MQALFDSIAQKQPESDDQAGEQAGDWPAQSKVFLQVGQMARQLHDTLGALRLRQLEKTVTAIPDKDRLAYIANLTEQAACKVLNATDIATPIQDELESGASTLIPSWDALYANELGVRTSSPWLPKRTLFSRTSCRSAPHQGTVDGNHDGAGLSGSHRSGDQEGHLAGPGSRVEADGRADRHDAGEKRTESVNSLLNGPVIDAEGRTDVVASQQQVDDLLDSLQDSRSNTW